MLSSTFSLLLSFLAQILSEASRIKPSMITIRTYIRKTDTKVLGLVCISWLTRAWCDDRYKVHAKIVSAGAITPMYKRTFLFSIGLSFSLTEFRRLVI